MFGSAVEIGVGGAGGVEGRGAFDGEEVAAEVAVVEVVGLGYECFPAGKDECCFVAEVVVLAGYAAVYFEGAVFEEAEGWTDGIGDAIVGCVKMVVTWCRLEGSCGGDLPPPILYLPVIRSPPATTPSADKKTERSYPKP